MSHTTTGFINTTEWQKKCYEEVFFSHKWGNSNNSGKTPKTGGYWNLKQAEKKGKKRGDK